MSEDAVTVLEIVGNKMGHFIRIQFVADVTGWNAERLLKTFIELCDEVEGFRIDASPFTHVAEDMGIEYAGERMNLVALFE
jgi:amino acid permease